MKLSFPWILSRKRLFVAVIVDGMLFTALYYVLYEWRFGVLPNISPRLAALLIIWSLVSYVVGRYPSGVKSRNIQHWWNLVLWQLIATVSVLCVTLGTTLIHIWLFNRYPVQASLRSFLVPFLGSLALLSPFAQLLIRHFSGLQDNSQNLTWSYVGTEAGFQQLQQLMKWSRVRARIKHVLPQYLDKSFSSRYIVDYSHDQTLGVLETLYQFQQKGFLILSLSSWCEIVLQRFPPQLLTLKDLLDGSFSMPSGTFQSRLKRLGDVVVSSILLILASPLMLISAFLIKIQDGGPIFYSQLRTGLHGNSFRIWKFRTMRIDAEIQGAQWSLRSDSRITQVGSILRRTRLDELPQLWCVLSGSMSLIGPRPERPEFDNLLSQKIPHYELRYLIRPGLSGWAQVNYPYGASVEDSANKLSYDLFYLKNFSFLLDLLILFKTIRLVFNAQGALPESFASSSNPI